MAETLRRIVLASRPQGHPVADNFRLEEAPLPTPGAGEMLVRVLWLSLDPYMRGRMDDAKSYSAPVPVSGTMEGGTVGQVIASNNPKFAAGDFVLTHSGWCSHAVSDGKGVRKLDPALAPLQANLGVLGMPGLTAYAGLAEHGRPKAGETLVVGAATGAVGSMVGQLAKIQGLRAVGVAGGAEKCAFAVEELGFDACIDHRAAADARALRAQIAAACPDGIDIYWENVGAETLEAVVPLMNMFGRIPVCGMIAWYDLGGLGLGAPPPGPNLLPQVWRNILVKRLAVRGFIVTDHADRFRDFMAEVPGYIRDGRVRYRESVTEGLENSPAAFMAMLKGGNFGKTLVRVAD
ncbi:MAG TPA: NADP-dependent oxidoreductase [Thermohalobaculum sp.]|nr:NADP-dependent oxidoreductase [Thermohalobaculum sp.]